MAIMAQACHELIDPDVLSVVIRKIADNFVSDRCSDEAMVVGLNTIRVCIHSRCLLISVVR
jgi:protein SDA1